MSTTTPSSKSLGKTSKRSRAEKPRHPARASRRTTITLSPESQEIVDRFKSAIGASTSAAIDRIIQSSEPKPSRLKEVNGFLVLNVPFRKVNVTLEDVKNAEDKMDREYVERLMPRIRKESSSTSGKRRRQ